MNIQKIRRLIIILLLLVTSVISLAIIYTSYSQREWATIASAMTVITAILAIWSSLSLTWRQEDEKRPQIDMYIDDTSHKHAYSLIIKNNGGSPAFNVRIKWITPPTDYAGQVPRFTDFDEAYDFDYLPTNTPYSRFLIGSDKFRDLIEKADYPLIYEGIVSYCVSSKASYRTEQPFKLSLEPFKKRLNVLNDQMDFYFENKKLSTHLKSISESLKELNKNLANKNTNPDS
jgi:hypothetical protein